jgi:hypothetical protein
MGVALRRGLDKVASAPLQNSRSVTGPAVPPPRSKVGPQRRLGLPQPAHASGRRGFSTRFTDGAQ